MCSLVSHYVLLVVILRAPWCNAHVQCACAACCVRGWHVGSRIIGCMLALLALPKGKWMEPKQHRFNVNSKVVFIIFHTTSGLAQCVFHSMQHSAWVTNIIVVCVYNVCLEKHTVFVIGHIPWMGTYICPCTGSTVWKLPWEGLLSCCTDEALSQQNQSLQLII